ncbi:sigma-70 family RNA polymerase sigma factor [Halobacillus sp. KGW1]|uniref:sigma-70 family RNA polymerase sigma factor n=1 Tax=Halobacillus sp. KGW1 TaxID=1793726 RepID=UPI0012901CAB|nr:sigma-70 family RNA polymerase sigma factor [Halobacillus sp. KGW1]
MSHIPSFFCCQNLVYQILHRHKIPEPYEDYCQEAYFIYKHCEETYDSSRGKFSTYYFHHLSWKLLSHLQSKRRLQLISTTQHPPFPHPKNDLHDRMFLLDLSLHADLTALEQSTCLLAMAGYRTYEIAGKIGKSESTVLRLRKSLREKLSSASILVYTCNRKGK